MNTSKLKNTLLRCAPSGMNGVTTMMCGSCSNEHAFKAVFKAKFSICLNLSRISYSIIYEMRIENLNEAYMNRERGTSNVSAEECLRRV